MSSREQSVNNILPNTGQTAQSHPSDRHEESTREKTYTILLTGGLLVRVQPEELSVHAVCDV